MSDIMTAEENSGREWREEVLTWREVGATLSSLGRKRRRVGRIATVTLFEAGVGCFSRGRLTFAVGGWRRGRCFHG